MVKATATKAAITGTRTAKPADKRGPKAGSAMANQSVKLSAPAKAKASDIINEVKSDHSGKFVAISAPGHDPIYVPTGQFAGNWARVGGSFKAAIAEWTKRKADVKAVPAKGIDAHNAPHTAKAIADRATKGKASPAPAPKAAPKATKAAPAPKATKADATPKATTGPDRAYKATKKEDTSKPDSFRRYMISTIRAHGSTGPAKAAHTASGKFSHERLNFKWAHDYGYITLADLK